MNFQQTLSENLNNLENTNIERELCKEIIFDRANHYRQEALFRGRVITEQDAMLEISSNPNLVIEYHGQRMLRGKGSKQESETVMPELDRICNAISPQGSVKAKLSPAKGKFAIRFNSFNGRLIEGGSASIELTKAVDHEIEAPNGRRIFLWGKITNGRGGHQDNVKKEIFETMKVVKENVNINYKFICFGAGSKFDIECIENLKQYNIPGKVCFCKFSELEFYIKQMLS